MQHHLNKPHLYKMKQLEPFSPTTLRLYKWGFQDCVEIPLFSAIADEALARVLSYSVQEEQWVGVRQAEIVRMIEAETTGPFAFWRRFKSNSRVEKAQAELNFLYYDEGMLNLAWDSHGWAVFFPNLRLAQHLYYRGHL